MSDSFKKFWDACLDGLREANAPSWLMAYCQKRADSNKGTIKAELKHWQQLQADPEQCFNILGRKKTIWTATVIADLTAKGKDGYPSPDKRRKALQELHALVLSLMLQGNEKQKVDKALQRVYGLLNIQPSPGQQQQIDEVIQHEFSELYGAIAALRFCAPVAQAMQHGKTGGKKNKMRDIRALIGHVLTTPRGQKLLQDQKDKRGFSTVIFGLLKPDSPYAALKNMPLIVRNSCTRNGEFKEFVYLLPGDWGWKQQSTWDKIRDIGKKSVYGNTDAEKSISFNAFSSAVSRARKDLKKKNS